MSFLNRSYKGAVIIICISGVIGCSTMKESGSRAITEAEYNASLPGDVYPASRSRIPIVNRAELDEAGKATYDRYMSPESTSLAGIQGPGGIRLHKITDKTPTRITGKIRELIRLVVAREMDAQFEWTLHEPVALREGLSPEIIDVIRYDRSLRGIPEPEAAIIQLGREIVREHRVSSETYARLSNYFGTGDLIQISELIGGGFNSFVLLFMFDAHLPYDREPLLPID